MEKEKKRGNIIYFVLLNRMQILKRINPIKQQRSQVFSTLGQFICVYNRNPLVSPVEVFQEIFVLTQFNRIVTVKRTLLLHAASVINTYPFLSSPPPTFSIFIFFVFLSFLLPRSFKRVYDEPLCGSCHNQTRLPG